MGRISGILWLLCAAAAALFAIQAQPVWGDHPLLLPAVGAAWLITGLSLIPAASVSGLSTIRSVFAAPVRTLRRAPAFYWLILLLTAAFLLGWWTVVYQPTNGRAVTPFEFAYLSLSAWVMLYLLRYGGSREEAIHTGRALAKNPLTGVLITLTTVLILFISAETYLRIFYITTDAYTFTAMNYWWYQNFYYPSFNTLGYRDDEPIPDAPRRIAVLGDSFAVGQGINNLDDTFGQLIERGLADGTDVNIIAQTGWDTDVQEFHLNQYPYQPDTVILSYYLNDIDYTLTAPEQSPDRNFQFPAPGFGSWFVLNFFVPNYVYYNLIQFTSPQRNANFLGDLIDAHLQPVTWERQRLQFDSLVAWTRSRNIRLIALIWPNPVGIDASAPAVQQVADYFRANGVEVVDMSEPLRPYPPTSLIVNNFDTHPGVLAHRLAAEALLPLLRAEP
ncbi:MAG: GDSL-type esterase/lipase family protein [bacterium]|nr:GDSL-type esterase/lipase family protein [bacterium]